jgi:hypothetical protein
MWKLCETYDRAADKLYLYLVPDLESPPRHPQLGDAKVLESFQELSDAQRFADGYVKALTGRGGDRPVQCRKSLNAGQK